MIKSRIEYETAPKQVHITYTVTSATKVHSVNIKDPLKENIWILSDLNNDMFCMVSIHSLMSNSFNLLYKPLFKCAKSLSPLCSATFSTF